jgi:hypothetical protein
MITIFATLQRELVIDGVVHVQHWRTKSFAVYQNYTLPVQSSDNPVGRVQQIAGSNEFHVYQVVQHNPGESLGDKLATFTDLQAAMTYIEKAERLA